MSGLSPQYVTRLYEGSNILIESRWADGNAERFPALAAELVALKVKVIMSTGGTLGALLPSTRRCR